MVWVGPMDGVDNDLFGSAVRVGDEIDRILILNVKTRPSIFQEYASPASRAASIAVVCNSSRSRTEGLDASRRIPDPFAI